MHNRKASNDEMTLSLVKQAMELHAHAAEISSAGAGLHTSGESAGSAVLKVGKALERILLPRRGTYIGEQWFELLELLIGEARPRLGGKD